MGETRLGPTGFRPPHTSPTPQVRLTHADRDQVAESLKDAYAQGQLDEEEFDHRLSLAMNAKIPADVEPLLRDLQSRNHANHATMATAGQVEEPPDAGDRLWAAGSHALGYFTLALGPLIALLVKGKSPYVRRHATEALNYQLTFLVASILVVPVGILTLGLGFIAYFALLLAWLVLPAIAACAAVLGASWKYPLTLRPVKDPS